MSVQYSDVTRELMKPAPLTYLDDAPAVYLRGNSAVLGSATVSGSPSLASSFGYRAGQYLQINASTKYASLGTVTSGAHTILFWFKATALGNMTVAGNLPEDYANGRGLGVKLRSDGGIWLRVGSQTTGSGFSDTEMIAAAYSAGTDTMIAETTTVESGGSLTRRWYVNGAKVVTRTNAQSINSSDSLRLGQNSSATAEAFTGSAGEFVKYNGVVLTDAQILTLYNRYIDTTQSDIALSRSGNAIPAGSTTPINLGRYVPGATASEVQFTITNNGTGNLTIDAVEVPSGVTLSTDPTGTVAQGGTATLGLTLDTAEIASILGDVNVRSDDPDTPGYEFTVSGTVAASTARSSLIPGMAL